MRVVLELRSQNNGTNTGDTWAFSGVDSRALRDGLDALDKFVTDAPLERLSPKSTWAVESDDRWRAAMLLWDQEVFDRHWRYTSEPLQADAAWTQAGARGLAELLPERLAELRTDILTRFSAER